MNYDEITNHLFLDFYESLSKNPESIDTFYMSDSKLIVSYPNEPQKVSLLNRFELLPKGNHKIFRWNGQKNGEQIIGHASGYVKVKSENDDIDKFYQCNEMIVYIHTPRDQNQNTTNPYQILYHSIHLSNMDPPPQPEPKLEQKTEELKEKIQSEEKDDNKKTTEPITDQTKDPGEKQQSVTKPTPVPPSTTKPTPPPSTTKLPVQDKNPSQQSDNSKVSNEKHPFLVDDANILIKSRTVLAYNLPYSVAQSSIIPEFEIYGKVTRYAIVKGRILIEFENPNSLMRALDDGDFYWNNRYIKIKQMEDQFN